MAASSTIEWTHSTWNPTTGCTKVSDGCDNCYAERFAERWRGVPGNYFGNGFDVELRPNMLERPSTWKGRRRLIFVNSMSDLFHVDVPDHYIDRVFTQMETVDRHVFQLLTKRPERMRRYLRRRYSERHAPDNVWFGVSIESGKYAWRVDMLRDVKAKTRFLSVEPMIGPVDKVEFDGIGWVIVGGESGPHKRAIDPDWVRAVRDRCVALEIPFFFKQWHKAQTGRLLDGRTWDEIPSY